MYIFQKQQKAHAELVDKLRALVVQVCEILNSGNVNKSALKKCEAAVNMLEVFSRNPSFTDMERRHINVNAKRAANWR